jgi:hypothetical protein
VVLIPKPVVTPQKLGPESKPRLVKSHNVRSFDSAVCTGWSRMLVLLRTMTTQRQCSRLPKPKRGVTPDRVKLLPGGVFERPVPDADILGHPIASDNWTYLAEYLSGDGEVGQEGYRFSRAGFC